MQPNIGRFGGSIVLITAAAHGIGRACAIRLAAEGARVTLADLDVQAADEAVRQLPGRGHEAIALDLTQQDSVEEAVKAAAADGLDVLVQRCWR